MKYAFFGTPEFAAIILEKLIKAGLPPALVVTNPDRPVGRKKIISPPPAKVIAEKNGIKVWQPERLEIENWKLKINKLGGVEFCIVAAYGKIIPKAVLDTLPAKFVGVHPSLLPRYRGATPIQTAILDGVTETGVAIFLMDEQIDHGPVIADRKLEVVGKMSYTELREKLAGMGAELLIEVIPIFLKNKHKLHPQNEKAATYTKKFTSDDAYVDLKKDDPITIERKVRALNPEPGVWTFYQIDGEVKRMKILEADLKDGKLVLKKIQFEGKKPQRL